MEQVDKIILTSLAAIGCDLEEDVESLSQLGMGAVVEGVVVCLKAIDAKQFASLSHKLPPNIAQRFRAATAIADAVKALGYTGDLGYQSLLYPNEVDVRRFFSFLLERLPKEDIEVQREDLSPAGVLLARAQQHLRQALSRPWLPPHCRHALLKRRDKLNGNLLMPLGETRHLRTFTSRSTLPLGLSPQPASRKLLSTEECTLSRPACLKRVLRDDSGQVDSRLLLCSILASHARQLQCGALPVRSSAKLTTNLDPLLHVISPSTDSLVTPLSPLSPMMNLSLDEPPPQEQQQSLEELRAEIAQLEESERQQLSVIHQAALQNEKLSAELEVVKESEREVRESLESAEVSLSLLASYEQSRARLESVIAAAPARAEKLREQFEQHCAPLKEQIEIVKNSVTTQQAEFEALTSEIEKLRSERQDFLQDIPVIEAQAETIEKKIQGRGQAISRSVYTKQILDITAKVHKQRHVTEEVLQNIRKLQKEINSLEGKIDRSFAVVEELSYQASWMTGGTGLYRTVIAMHDACNEIVDVLRETGVIKRKTADLREQVAQEQRKDIAEALSRLKNDLSAVKQENELLKSRIASNAT
ncbi:coiled-coil domain-containing protein 22 homolog [Hyalella azteca]|uniref:Coiled-coil domain-containing protein 22 homolog n=1 Tax=Hyalella azteca TaxID=294128 RepID=A0A8B7NBR6_HYAAZ|nr:coiled-coil domain-containing protein 22 homolog [Hyalella azteca]